MRQFEGNLFVGAEAGRYLLRVRIDPADPLTVISTERLLADRVGGIRAVTVGADGAIYFSTSDTLTRIVPRSQSDLADVSPGSRSSVGTDGQSDLRCQSGFGRQSDPSDGWTVRCQVDRACQYAV